ncbi:hypothetical protein BDY24DRAFT_405666 [Mrakia frigida]|uniref:uncharacterized protein n=1 Tax=Mrakia frigida TaxID=29902 RepID=UPI003FCC2036
MSTFPFPIPTTGAISFSDFLSDPQSNYTLRIAEATSARASLRGILKQERRTGDGERDARAVVNAVEEYLPLLSSIVNCLGTDDLLLQADPPFSWRTTLTSTHHPNPPRLTLPSFLAEQTFVLLTYIYSLSNLSTSLLLSLNPTSSTSTSSRSYELDPTMSSAERKKKDDKLGQAADLLCRAAGIGEWMSERVVGEWERERSQKGGGGKAKGPVEGSRGFVMGLSKMLLADAQLLSIRKLLSPSISSSPHSGPPLSKTHPSPSLLSKLYLQVLALYTSALTLVRSSSSSAGAGSLSTDEPLSSLIKYLKEGRDFSEAMSRKWLGVDAGENGNGERTGEAIVWLRDSRKTLLESSGSSGSSGGVGGGSGNGGGKVGGLFKKSGSGGKEEKKERKGKFGDALESVESFLKAYEKANDQVYFSPLPPLSSLLPRIPAGRAVLASKPFLPPQPLFGPGAPGYVSRGGDSGDGVEELGEGMGGLRFGGVNGAGDGKKDDEGVGGEGYF